MSSVRKTQQVWRWCLLTAPVGVFCVEEPCSPTPSGLGVGMVLLRCQALGAAFPTHPWWLLYTLPSIVSVLGHPTGVSCYPLVPEQYGCF